MKMSITPDGVEVEIEEAGRDGKVHKKTYKAEDMEAFKGAHPDVVERFGIGGSGIRSFGGDPSSWRDLSSLRWSWPRQLRHRQPPLFADPRMHRLFVQDPFQIDADRRDEGRDMPLPGERLGIYASDAPAGVAEFLGLAAGQGLRVEDVVKGSLADTLGIQKGDIVFQIADRKIFAVGDVRQALRRIRAGDTVGVQVNRRGRVLALKAKKPAVLEDEKIEDQEVEARVEAEAEPKKLKQRGKLR
jgi:hypothetical protein